MTTAVDARKAEERELHDALRGRLSTSSFYTSNKKMYAIASTNRAFVEDWLRRKAPGARALDYCCGDGEMALFCAQAGAEVWGIDISPVAIENARLEASAKGLSDRVSFVVMDGEATTFPDDFFDVVVVHGVLHHLDLNKAYRELSRITKPDGEVICTEALRHNPAIQLYRRLTPHLRSAWETDHILGRREIAEARRYFRSAQVARFFHLATIAAIPFRRMALFPALVRVLHAADTVLLRVPGMRWHAWMAVFILRNPRRLDE